MVSGDGLKAYSVVCGSFGVKANADGLKSKLDGDGYNAKVVYNAERNMYRVVVESFDTRDEAARARDAFKQNILHVKISKVLGYCIVCINVI